MGLQLATMTAVSRNQAIGRRGVVLLFLAGISGAITLT
jgi:hypothetical protein